MSEKRPAILLTKANKLLERPPGSEYVEEWTAILGQERGTRHRSDTHSVVLFRIGAEWLALSTQAFSEVTEMRLIRRIPHRSDDILRGLVNLRGQLCLCIDLGKLLEIDTHSVQAAAGHRKMVAIGENKQRWIFVADEVLGIFNCDMGALENVPVTVAKSATNYLKGLIGIEGKHASLLDEELLLYSLEKRMT